MTLRTTTAELDRQDPLDAVELVLEELGWSHERDEQDGLQCIAPTRWGEMGCLFASRKEPSALHFSLTMDIKPQAARHNAIIELIILMNERIWLGHLDFWIDDQVIIFRHAIPLAGRQVPTLGEVKAVLSAAMETAERFIPAINFVIWAGKSPREAMAAAMFETAGEA